MRSYRDMCGIARALDVVGERWALLIVRELILGAKRFADLHRGLSGMSANVLTQRLRDLELSGVLVRRRALAPAAGLVYELTDRGRALEPVLLALGRWGSPLPPRPDSASELSPDALVVALRTTFDPTHAAGLRGVVQLRLPGDAFQLALDRGRFEASRRDAAADAILDTTVRVVQDLVFDGRELDDAVRSGEAVTAGDRGMLQRFLAAFDDRRQTSASGDDG